MSKERQSPIQALSFSNVGLASSSFFLPPLSTLICPNVWTGLGASPPSISYELESSKYSEEGALRYNLRTKLVPLMIEINKYLEGLSSNHGDPTVGKR
jgi:hypothetical protein